MTYDSLLDATRRSSTSLTDFFVDANIPPIKTDVWKNENRVPQWVGKMLFLYIEQEMSNRDDPEYMKAMKEFLFGALDEGIVVKDGKAIVSLTGTKEITITAAQIQHVRFTL